MLRSPRWSAMIVDRPSASGPYIRTTRTGTRSSGPVLASNGVTSSRRLPVGAEPGPDGGFRFRVWAPRRRRVEVIFEDGQDRMAPALLAPEAGGYFSGHVVDAVPGLRYRYRLDDDESLYPDPASRFQPDGPHGPSETIDPSAFNWTDGAWHGAKLKGQVLYELHVGTFTMEGTWAAAAREIPELARLGVTCLEVMPVGDFPGRFGWGYDGVNLFAPTRLYGRPDDFRLFVNEAHANGLAVILDVVYNHLGPDGNYLGAFSEAYVTDRYLNEWGEAINFDGPDAGPSREFFIANAGYWIDEYHLDGLRLDATQQMFDASPVHILTEIGRRVREMGRGRATIISSENEPQETRIVRPVEQGGYGLDALWNDDFHHSAMVAMTGRNEAYYTDYHGTPQELISAVKYGYLYQGQHYSWQKQRRGTAALDLDPSAFVSFIQNHDQVANTARGERVHNQTSPGRYRAMTALMLLAPATPMLFQGQEFAASTPFLYFCDHTPDLASMVKSGRTHFLRQFPSIRSLIEADTNLGTCLADPGSSDTFERCKLDWSERERHADVYALHADLLRLRREDPVFAAGRNGGVDGAVLGGEALALRFFGTQGGDHLNDRLLLVNLGRDLNPQIVPEPLLAPPDGCVWETLFSTEAPRYGGGGTAPVETADGWHLPGHAAVVLCPRPASAPSDALTALPRKVPGARP
jgi:maltooligosyltrehalose trehalohydrolase